MAALSRTSARVLVPRTSVCAGPLQDLKMAACHCTSARELVPRTSVGVKPLEQLKVPAICGGSACPQVPLTAIGASALNYGDAAAPRREAAGCVDVVGLTPLVLRRPRPPVAKRPLEQRRGFDNVRVGGEAYLGMGGMGWTDRWLDVHQ